MGGKGRRDPVVVMARPSSRVCLCDEACLAIEGALVGEGGKDGRSRREGDRYGYRG